MQKYHDEGIRNSSKGRAGAREAPRSGSPAAPALEDLRLGLIEIDRASRITYANPAAADLLRTSPDALVGKTLHDAVSEGAYPRIFEEVNRSLEKNSPADFDVLSPEEKDLWLHCRIDPSRRGLIITLEDASERMAKEKSLKASEEKYRSIFDSANDAIFIHDPDTGAILDVNRKMAEMYGYTEEEARTITVEDISSGIPPYNQEGAARRIHNAMEHGGDIFEWQGRDKSGRVFWEEVTLKLTEIDGRPNVVAIVRDITDRKAAEEALKESEERFRAVFENTSEAIIVTDPQGSGRVLSVNPAACRMFGYSEDEFIGLDRESILVTADPNSKVLMTQREKNGAASAVLTYKRKDGTRFIGEASSVYFEDQSGNRKAVAAIRDITERRKAEETLRISEERYRTLYDSMSQGVIEFDDQSRIMSANSAAKKILGLDFDRMKGMTAQEIFGVAPEMSTEKKTIYRASELALMHAQLTGKAMKSHRIRVRNSETGEYRWVLVDSFPRSSAGEGSSGITTFVIFSDVTELMRVQEALEMTKIELEQRVKTRTKELMEQKELLQTIMDRIPVIVTFWDPQCRLGLVNKEFERLTGWSQQEASSMDILAAGFPDPAYRKKITRLVSKADPGWGEFELTTRSGNILTIAWASVSFSDGSIIGIGIDVTEHNRMEVDLMRLFAAVEQTGEGIALASPDGVIEYVNPAYEKMSGYRRDELIGQRVGFFKEYFEGLDLEETFERIIREGKSWSGRQSRRKKTGELIEVDAIASPVRDRNGKIINYISVARDVTREVRLQKQLFQTQKMEAVGALAGGIAHDLKNILTPILINTEIAIEELGSEHPAKPVLEEALDAAKLGKDLVQGILTFSRQVPRSKSLVNISAVIRETLSFLRSTLPTTIEIRSEIKDEHIMACADPTQIKQVLINLGSNAGFAMREHGGTLEVIESSIDLNKEEAEKVAPGLAPGPYIQVAVRDTGYGMDEETLGHIFEPFFTTKKGEGTGMGLAVAHGIVEDHQGAITVQSRPGQGTAFFVYLPGTDDGCPEESTREQSA